MTESIRDYFFTLPDELIAQKPADSRENARLLLVRRNPAQGLPQFEDLLVKDLPELIKNEASLKNSLWLRNRSKVFPARFYANRPTGSKHEIVLIEKKSNGHWYALIRGEGSFKYPQKLIAPNGDSFYATEARTLDFSTLETPLEKLLDTFGEMPLPPYIKTRNQDHDRKRYQPIWAREDKTGSAAAPTASLHFTDTLLGEMEKDGASFADVILHVGLGTFEPLRHEKLDDNELHSEFLEIELAQKQKIELAIQNKHPIVPIGTTALRNLESVGLAGNAHHALANIENNADGSLCGRSKLFIKPGFEFRYTSALFTNFHLPESSLLVLVSTFAKSKTLALEAYKHAVNKNYRFFSFGDASLWI